MTKQPRKPRETADERKERLAQALRANLQKRKSQARQRRGQQASSDPQKANSEIDRS